MVGRQGQHGVGAVEQQAQPFGAVVERLGGQHLRGLQAQCRQYLGQVGGFGRAACQRRRGKGHAHAAVCGTASQRAQRHHAHGAFLAHFGHLACRACGLGLAAVGQPGVAGAQGGVAGKGQLAAGGEDAHAVVGSGGPALGCGRQHEGGFRQVGPAGEALHGFVAQAGAVQHHGQRVAQVGDGGEHVHLHERALAQRWGGVDGGGHHSAAWASRMVWASAAMPMLIWLTLAVTNDRRMLRGSALSA